MLYNVYCDESTHLEHDHISTMVLGAIWCPEEKVREVITRMHEIKVGHGVSKDFEAKWTKVSPSGLGLYMDIVNYFFDDDDLHFRCVVIPDKSKLQHARFNQDHDSWYYKMYFTMLKTIFSPDDTYNIYLDIKDSHGGRKVGNLHRILSNSMYDFDSRMVQRVQLVRSHEVELLQLADILIGAVNYANRGLETSSAKLALVRRVQKRSRYDLFHNTLYRAYKFNLLHWHASEGLE